MPPRSDERYDSQRITGLEREVGRLWRAMRTPRRARIGDSDDVQAFGAADGFAHVFDRDTGLWKPVIPPPMVTFYWNTPAVEAGKSFGIPADCKLFLWSLTLDTAGSSTTTVQLRKKTATTITTDSLVSSDTYEQEALGYALAQGDRIFPEITAVGTGALGLTVSVWAKAL